LYFLDRFSKNTQMSRLMKIRPTGAELFHADGQADVHDEADIGFSQFCERGPKTWVLIQKEGVG